MQARRSRALLVLAAALAALAGLPASAAATPVATSDSEYAALGRVFPDPLAGCQNAPADPSNPCSPNAEGNVPATQFIQYKEFVDALEYLNSKPEWQRYLEVLPLDGAIGPGSGTTPGDAMFPGDDLPELEFDPKRAYRSAGLPQSDLSRKRSDLIVLRVTDENVPDAGKKRFATSLSIHGIERAGVEGGTRAAEDLVTADTLGTADTPIVPDAIDPGAPSFGDVLDKAIIYFVYPNPDGWRRGSISEGGVFFQRYNGNGVDINRDWPDIGYSFRPYSGFSEPETRALRGFFTQVRERGGPFSAGDDLHGQPFADALSYTLLPHGSHTYAKNERIKDAAIAIHRNSEQALSWSPIIQPNDAPRGGELGCTPETTLGTPCSKIYGQTWGTVYDTINYTTTGALGDWFDSSVGLRADGIDNEMSFSHLDKDIVFDPHSEQLHVDGNKALLYAHLDQILNPPHHDFDAPGRKGYVPNLRLKRDEKVFQEQQAPPNTVAQDDISAQLGSADQDLEVKFPFTVERTAPAAGEPGIFNGGMRVDVTTANAAGVGSGIAHLEIQCKGCTNHPGEDPDGDGFVTVAEDFNQSPIYLQSGVSAAINHPQALDPDGGPVKWRAVLSGDALGIGGPSPSPVASMDVDFSSGPATTSGSTGGDHPPKLAAYDVANTDFFDDLNGAIPGTARDFRPVDPRAVIEGRASLDGLDSLVLSDEPLPGYTGDYGDVEPPTGPPTEDFSFEGTASVPGASSGVPGTYEEFPFTIGPDDGNGKMTIRIDWDVIANDFDMFLYRVEENGDRTQVGSSTGTQGETDFEQIVVEAPAAGDYVIRVDNYAAADPRYQGSVTFEPPSGGDEGPVGTGAYTVAEKDAWMDALRDFVSGGGNLVLTDGAVRALADLAGLAPEEIGRQTVYAGQSSFSTPTDEDTTDDPLASDPEPIAQPGARFQTGMRRQTYEPTPLGFAIQDATGSDQSNARQYDVDLDAFEAAGGRVVATSADSGDRDAQPVLDRVTVGEIGLGDGQIRIAGALLPQPTTEFDHEFGLEPYAVTYTGYILIRDLLEVDASTGSDAGPGPEPNPDPEPSPDPKPGPRPDPEPGLRKGRCANRQVGSRDDDRLRGTRAGDDLRGRAGDDRLGGRRAGDCLRGGRGGDRLRGGRGKDELRGGRGRDRLRAGKGGDVVRARDGRREQVHCGGGRDRAIVDRRDRVHGCERVRRK